MRIVKGLIVTGLLVAGLLLSACGSSEMSIAEQQAAQEHLRRICSEHYAHIAGLNDGRYGRTIQKDYAQDNICPNNHDEINEEYLDGFKYGMAHKS